MRVFRDIILIVVGPGGVQVAVDLTRFFVRHVELLAPTSKGVASCVRAETSPEVRILALNLEPPESQVDGVSDVVLSVESSFVPPWVVPDVTSWKARVVELEARDGTS